MNTTTVVLRVAARLFARTKGRLLLRGDLPRHALGEALRVGGAASRRAVVLRRQPATWHEDSDTRHEDSDTRHEASPKKKT